MSLGFTPMTQNEVMRRQTGAGIEGMRPSSSRRPGGGSNPGSVSTNMQDVGPPIKLRVEVLELALRTLSANVQEIEDRIDHGTSATTGASYDHTGLESNTSTLVDDHLVKRIQSLESQINTITTKSRDNDSSVEKTPGSHIKATVSQCGARIYSNTTGNFREDVKGEHTTLPAGSKVRMFFPQEQLDAGMVCMGAMYVDDNMTIHSGWLVICNTETGDRYVEDFQV